jgi:hypothetical protein
MLFPMFYMVVKHRVTHLPSFQFYNFLHLRYFASYCYCRAFSSVQWYKVVWIIMDSCLTVEHTEQYEHSNCYFCSKFNIRKWQNLKVMREVPVCCIFHSALRFKKLHTTFWYMFDLKCFLLQRSFVIFKIPVISETRYYI